MKKKSKKAPNSTALFSYKIGNSFIHKLHPIIKVILLFALPISIFFLPLPVIGLFSLVCIILSLFVPITIKEQLRNVKPVLYYCTFLLIIYLWNILFSNPSNGMQLFSLAAKLVCSMQWTSLFFTTTTSIELQNTLEKFLPSKIAKSFSLFINFIPMLFSVWNQLERAWTSRGGKNGITKITTLLPVFLSVSLHKAYNVSRTLENRS